jgi:NMD protein affecting ribosome stability and mRNA decay
MHTSATCPKCGAVVPADAPAGLCPQCLLAAGLAGQTAQALKRIGRL